MTPNELVPKFVTARIVGGGDVQRATYIGQVASQGREGRDRAGREFPIEGARGQCQLPPILSVPMLAPADFAAGHRDEPPMLPLPAEGAAVDQHVAYAVPLSDRACYEQCTGVNHVPTTPTVP